MTYLLATTGDSSIGGASVTSTTGSGTVADTLRSEGAPGKHRLIGDIIFLVRGCEMEPQSSRKERAYLCEAVMSGCGIMSFP